MIYLTITFQGQPNIFVCFCRWYSESVWHWTCNLIIKLKKFNLLSLRWW